MVIDSRSNQEVLTPLGPKRRRLWFNLLARIEPPGRDERDGFDCYGFDWYGPFEKRRRWFPWPSGARTGRMHYLRDPETGIVTSKWERFW